MTKVWEETWVQTQSCCIRLATTVPTIAWFAAEGSRDGDLDCDRARLAAAAPEMARLLLQLEWTQGGVWDPAGCHVCLGGRDSGGHKPDCAYDALMRKAGVR